VWQEAFPFLYNVYNLKNIISPCRLGFGSGKLFRALPPLVATCLRQTKEWTRKAAIAKQKSSDVAKSKREQCQTVWVAIFLNILRAEDSTNITIPR
jgi:hypothetical protein